MLKKTASMILAAMMALSAPLSAQAKTEELISAEKKNIVAAVQELETIFDAAYTRTKRDAAELTKDGYDYELTMESLEIQGKPYAEFDYRGFLAAYATIRTHAADLGDGINEIPFIQMEYEEETVPEYEPIMRDRYVETEDGIYEKDGIWFLTEPCEVDTYELLPDGIHYGISGQEWVDLDPVETKYAKVTLSMIELEDIYHIFHLARETYQEEEDARLKKIEEIMGDAKIEQNAFFTIFLPSNTEEANLVYAGITRTSNPIRQVILAVAASIIGRVPYEWGGKADHTGFDPSWYTFDESGRQKGLDCSGFTQWVLWTAGYANWSDFGWTGDYLDNDLLEVITQDELKPGDFGLFYPNTDQINHIGIYVGNGYWIHCSSGKNTVTVSDHMKFSVFRRLAGIDEADEDEDSGLFAETLSLAKQGLDSFTGTTGGTGEAVDDPDILLMAKIVQLESYGEGYNGWIAVAEVIRNRILSDNFPRSVYEVVSAPKQFATWNASQKMEDEEVDPAIIQVCEQVMAGTLGYLNNEKVIGFRTKRPEPDDFTFSGWDRFTVLGNHSFYLEN